MQCGCVYQRPEPNELAPQAIIGQNTKPRSNNEGLLNTLLTPPVTRGGLGGQGAGISFGETPHVSQPDWFKMNCSVEVRYDKV